MASASLFGWVLMILVFASGSIVLIASDDITMSGGLLPQSFQWEYENNTVDFSTVTDSSDVGLPHWVVESGTWEITGGKLTCTGVPIYDWLWNSAAEVYFDEIKTDNDAKVTNTYYIENPGHGEFHIYLVEMPPGFSHKIYFGHDGTHLTLNNANIASSSASFTHEDAVTVTTYYNTNGDYLVRANDYEILSGNAGSMDSHLGGSSGVVTARYGGVGSWETDFALSGISSSSGKMSKATDSGGLTGAVFAAGRFDVLAFMTGMISVMTWGITPSPIGDWMWVNVPAFFIVLFIIIPEIIAMFVFMQMIRGN